MEPYKIAIAVLVAAQLFTLFALRLAIKRGNFWFDEWERNMEQNMKNTLELMLWKHNAVLRDPKTGRYVKKDKHS